MEALIYLRQSLDKKGFKTALKTQEKLLRDLITRDYSTITTIRTYSDVSTGRHTQRSGIQNLIESIVTGKHQYLFIYRLNRLARNTKDFNEILTMCAEYNVIIVSYREGVINPNESFLKLKAQIFSAISEIESDNIGKNFKSAFRVKASKGKLLSAKAPYGYLYADEKFKADLTKVSTIRYVFDLYCKGYGYKKISQTLTVSKDYDPRTPQQVRSIVTNSKYAGIVENDYGKYQCDYIEPIISIEQFKKAESVRLARQKDYTEGPRALLRKKIRCPVCGVTMTPIKKPNRGRTLEYYVCGTVLRSSHNDCSMSQIRRRALDEEVEGVIESYIKKHHLHIIERRIRDIINTRYSAFNDKDVLIDALASGNITHQEFKQTLLINKQTATIKKNILSTLEDSDISTLIHINDLTFEQKHNLVERAFVSKTGVLEAIKIKSHNIILQKEGC